MTSIINTSRIALVGLGQLGGSLALRFREISCNALYGIARKTTTIERAMELKMLDAASTNPEEILPVVDITFLCLPLGATIDFVKKNLKHFRVGSIVTDVGSAKERLVNEVRDLLHDAGVYFIGGHPMAGSEKSGIENSRSDLYQDSIVFLTPTPEDNPDAINLVKNFWRDIGACSIELDAKRHDQALAFSSHALHLISASLCKTVLHADDSEARSLSCAGSFRDMSRVASSNPQMWTEISKFNKKFVLEAMKAFQADLDRIYEEIENQDWDKLSERLRHAKSLRDKWYEDYGKPTESV